MNTRKVLIAYVKNKSFYDKIFWNGRDSYSVEHVKIVRISNGSIVYCCEMFNGDVAMDKLSQAMNTLRWYKEFYANRNEYKQSKIQKSLYKNGVLTLNKYIFL